MMVSNYLNMFEGFIERWQSRRKTILISSSTEPTTKSLNKCPEARQSTGLEKKKKNKKSEPSGLSNPSLIEHAKQRCSPNQEEDEEKNAYKLIGDKIDSHTDCQQSPFELRMQTNPDRPTLANCPSLLFTSIALICLISLNLSCFEDNQALADLQQPSSSISTIAGNDWRQAGRDLISRLRARQPSRWAFISEPANSIRDSHRMPIRENLITRTLNRVSTRIGSRNTIRVHNAFRDLAWRLLSGFSMPTPVIYELRRQHFYSPEEDLMNDSLHSKNTSKTIRSRRLFWPLKSFDQTTRSGVDVEDETTDNLRRRLQVGLENLINLSRRSLFGRVIRVPTLFPFKRQEGTDNEAPAPTGKSSNKKANSTNSSSRRRRLLGRRRKKETDRQMISIDGKQYYIDDDGALKELNDKSES